MTATDRKYGEKESRPIPIWNGILEHRGRIGHAVWEFLWCLDRITKERDGVGIVLGGAPVKVGDIAGTIKGSKKETVRRHLEHLEKGKYIRLRRTPYGHVIEVLNSRKFGIWRKEKPQNDVSRPPEKPIYEPEKPTSGSEKPKNVGNKEDAAVTQQKDAAAGRSAVWQFLGVDGSRWTGPIREVCANLYGEKNGQTPIEFIGACMDAISVLGVGIPPAMAQSATVLRSQAKPRSSEPMQELEAPAWA
jgi:hypothetical protein